MKHKLVQYKVINSYVLNKKCYLARLVSAHTEYTDTILSSHLACQARRELFLIEDCLNFFRSCQFLVTQGLDTSLPRTSSLVMNGNTTETLTSASTEMLSYYAFSTIQTKSEVSSIFAFMEKINLITYFLYWPYKTNTIHLRPSFTNFLGYKDRVTLSFSQILVTNLSPPIFAVLLQAPLLNYKILNSTSRN